MNTAMRSEQAGSHDFAFVGAVEISSLRSRSAGILMVVALASLQNSGP